MNAMKNIAWIGHMDNLDSQDLMLVYIKTICLFFIIGISNKLPTSLGNIRFAPKCQPQANTMITSEEYQKFFAKVTEEDKNRQKCTHCDCHMLCNIFKQACEHVKPPTCFSLIYKKKKTVWS